MPALIFPLFLLAVNSGGLKDATNLPGFPTDSYLTFALAVPFMQGALFSVMNAGTDLARDIETGFLNPVRPGVDARARWFTAFITRNSAPCMKGTARAKVK